MRRIALTLSLILAATSAVAEPAYVGTWTMRPGPGCLSPVTITATKAEADEWQCSIPPTRPQAGVWRMTLQCAQEGEEYAHRATWRVQDGKLITMVGRTREVYRRCPR
ncbi:hypothetical protein ASG59_18590 [Methylobacterium sp. Leaf466]|nr:hypothetical protein ASG59_18590 [Methylobacterium sp. Leaf466]